ncbi:hypothetical protein RB2501_11002 [Robiginitalea biformata HTCC2501]|uniref:Uncharacterized protein n=1 Tax=Robiginitalea biformata (strain ATCC BAA-864 / DSM 15991 / KCTC 12146 / HTCC2501) TaxID=313596 RepID=A4CMF7_ROBBH|nr:hypothetical protein RB2501_11002 [Robiginitalea biformata HTCC2501]
MIALVKYLVFLMIALISILF